MPAEIYRCYQLKHKGEKPGEGEVSLAYFEMACMYKEFPHKLEVELYLKYY